MVKKSKFIVFLILAISLIAIVLALGESTKITSPASGSNYTSISSVLFNVSFINNSDITQPSNASFFLNISGTWTKIGNTSSSGGCQVGQTVSSCAATITNTAISDGVYSINATIFNSSTSISITSRENLSNLIYIDSTPPIAYDSNFSNPLVGKNYSQNLIINISSIDTTIGIQSVIFNITNSTGQQNSTIIATREGSTNNFVATINTSNYHDGSYNITAYINDSLGNLNNSAKTYQLTFDNTLPSLSHSCDVYSAEENDVITCSCSSSDSLSGINSSYGSSGVSFTANPSTSSTGNNLETTCTTQDRAGNLNTSILYYNVTSIRQSSSGSGGSGGSSSSSTSGNSSNNSTNQDKNKNVNLIEGNQQGLQSESGKTTVTKSLIWIILGIVAISGISVVAVKFIKRKGFIKR
jgi:hypothetical protein